MRTHSLLIVIATLLTEPVRAYPEYLGWDSWVMAVYNAEERLRLALLVLTIWRLASHYPSTTTQSQCHSLLSLFMTLTRNSTTWPMTHQSFVSNFKRIKGRDIHPPLDLFIVCIFSSWSFFTFNVTDTRGFPKDAWVTSDILVSTQRQKWRVFLALSVLLFPRPCVWGPDGPGGRTN